jgi:acyl-coenzyme A thioesterase PaaI-like protein
MRRGRLVALSLGSVAGAVALSSFGVTHSPPRTSTRCEALRTATRASEYFSYKAPFGAQVTSPGFERVDQKLMNDPKYQKFVKDHAIHDTLSGKDMVEQYEWYINKETEELLAVTTVGKSLNGYPGVVHGGILGLLIDNSFGILFLNLNKPLSVTANLSINYRAPTYASTQVVLYAKIDRVEGRKMFMTALVWEARSGKVLVDATTLFIAIKKPWWDPFNLLGLLKP